MIRTFLDLHVKPGQAEQLTAAFENMAILDQSIAQQGCHSAELSVSADGTTMTVTATWDSPEAYAAWTTRDDRADLAEQLNPHLVEPLDRSTVGRIHNVLIRKVANDTRHDHGGSQ